MDVTEPSPESRRVGFAYCEVVGESATPCHRLNRERYLLFLLLHSSSCQWYTIINRGRHPLAEECTCHATTILVNNGDHAKSLLAHFLGCEQTGCRLCGPVSAAWRAKNVEVLFAHRFATGQRWAL